MYRLFEYQNMILDEARTGAYVRAIQAAVRPGCTVVEIGTGFGYFAVVACQAGAARVYAVEPNQVVHLGPELARANGCEDRIVFIQDVSGRTASEPADVLVSDLRGVLPLLDEHIPNIRDARRRLLKPGGIQIPARDTIQLALVRSFDGGSEPTVPTPDALHGVDLSPLGPALTHLWRPRVFDADELMSAPGAWQVVDYRTVESADLDGEVELVADRAGRAEGIGMWFDAELYCGHGFSTAPGGPRTVYGQGFFPLPAPIPLEAGDPVRVRMRAKLVGAEYVWSWEGEVMAGRSRGLTFFQSTFHAFPLDGSRLRRRADRFVPRLRREGRAHAWILGRMAAGSALGDIARGAVAAFPDVFAGFPEALRTVADLSERYSERYSE